MTHNPKKWKQPSLQIQHFLSKTLQLTINAALKMNSSTETTETTTSNTTAVLVEMKPRRATWQTALPTFHLPKAVGVPVVIQCLNIRLVPDCLAATTTNLNSLCKNKMCWWEFCQNQEHNSSRHSKILETTYENCWSPTSVSYTHLTLPTKLSV